MRLIDTSRRRRRAAGFTASFVSLAALAALAACAVGPDDGASDPGATQQEQPLENLDRTNGAAGTTHELAMIAGRINKVPVSWVFQGQFTHVTTAAATVHVRAKCTNAAAASDECDPGLAVIALDAAGNVVDVLFNNNSSLAGGNAFGAYLAIPQAAGASRTYKVVAYSHHRGTSRVDVQWDTTAPGGTADWDAHGFVDPQAPTVAVSGTSRVVGGTLIKVGPGAPGQNLNVRTVDDAAAGENGTRIWVFNPSRRQFAFSDGATTGDRDPNVTFTSAWACDASCATNADAASFAIVGKDVQSSARPEIFVDVAKSISAADTMVNLSFGSVSGSNARPDFSDASGASLSAGTYYVSVFANTQGFGVGDVPAVDGKNHPAVETGDTSFCGNSSVIHRGQGNDLAFSLDLIEDGVVVKTRHVPRGALGAAAVANGETQWNRVTLDHVVKDNGRAKNVKVAIRDVGPGILLRGQWAHRQNPDTVELKVASLNLEYDDPDLQKQVEVENAADLLGAGPTYSGVEVIHRNNRGKWRWEADLLSLNEIKGGRGTWMEQRLDARTKLDWKRSEGESIWGTGSGIGGQDRQGPVIVNERMILGGGDPSFGTALDGLPECGSELNHCKVATVDVQAPAPNRVYYTVPAKTAARRMKGSTGGFLERPITTFNLYLPYADDEITDRDKGTTNLVARMKSIMGKVPQAFNSSGSTNPKDPGNRMIILGDLNMHNQQCAENNTLLRKLRAEFGYAVDVAMATTDSSNRTYDGHYSGAPITDFRTGTYGSCNDASWARPYKSGDGCPFHYDNSKAWDGRPVAEKYKTGLDQWHTWWAGTSSGGGGGGSRLDVVILAGLGWADDDPVMEYLAMPNTDVPNPGNGFQSAGVEIKTWCSDPQIVDKVANGPSYQPENQICTNEGATMPGSTAFRTDHKPVGTRLRVQFNR